jgi:large subunit ribosomal protein L10
MTRNTLIKQAFQELGGDIGGLEKHISGHSALIFTDDNPFRLYKQLEKTKTKMAAKPGEKAPEDIVVEKGPTSFRPGPIVGDLQKAGLPAAIEAGKVKIRETKTVAEGGRPSAAACRCPVQARHQSHGYRAHPSGGLLRRYRLRTIGPRHR